MKDAIVLYPALGREQRLLSTMVELRKLIASNHPCFSILILTEQHTTTTTLSPQILHSICKSSNVKAIVVDLFNYRATLNIPNTSGASILAVFLLKFPATHEGTNKYIKDLLHHMQLHFPRLPRISSYHFTQRDFMIMDSSDSTHNDDTTEKLPTGETVTGVKDIISCLHESILGHILSLLPTIEAVHTCLLSGRWIDVWKSITGLWFDDSFLCYGKVMQKEQFVQFVNKVLLHLANSSIQNFSLCLTRYNYESYQVSAWISSILQRGVQKLHVQYADKVLLPSNHSLFKCTSLVQLVLQMRCTLSVPISACLPNLQSLSISAIKFVSDLSTNHLEDLTLNFPVLKVFEARGCEWSTMQNISIQAPLLVRFSIAIWNSMSNELSKSAIKVFAPQLRDFSYEGDLEQDIILLSPSSIVSASVVIVIDDDRTDRLETFRFQAHKFLSQIHEVEQLKLLFYKVLIHAKDIFTHLAAFGRLTYLQLNEVTGEGLLNLLHNCPFLNTLVLLNGVSDFNRDVLASSSVPQCFMSSLRNFQFKGFNVHEHEICLAKFVMANAAVLELMSISMAFWLRYSNIDMEKVKENILSFPKCSSFAIVEFSNFNG